MIQLYLVFDIATLIAPPGVTRRNFAHRPKYDLCKYNFTVRVISLWNGLPTRDHSRFSRVLRLGQMSFVLMKKHVSTTRPTYLAAVLQDASKSYCVFVIMHYSVRCGHRGLRPMPVYCTFMFMYYYKHANISTDASQQCV